MAAGLLFTLQLLGSVRTVSGVMRMEADKGGSNYMQKQALNDFILVKAQSIPDHGCAPGNNFPTNTIGYFRNLTQCATAAKNMGAEIFSYREGGRFRFFCHQELIPHGPSVWAQWNSGAEPECPNGAWHHDVYSNIYAFPPTTSAPTPAPTAPTPAPTSAPTPASRSAPIPPPPTRAPAPTLASTTPVKPPTAEAYGAAGMPHVSATGDPHLMNIHGQRFDLMQPGTHSLLCIPRYAKPYYTLLGVTVYVARLGSACADMYIQSVNVTGKWVRDNYHGDRFYSVSQSNQHTSWEKFDKISVKVVHGHTKEGFAYLNVLVRNLKNLRFPIGGLLGEDDHTAAATPDRSCRRMMLL